MQQTMVARLAAYDPAHPIKDSRVLDAMREVPRHLFVPKHIVARAYEDTELPIGQGQTISAPFIVAYMAQTLEPKPSDKVLEIGTGSGYEAAVLSRLAGAVYTVEIVPSLAKRAGQTLHDLGYANVWVRRGDGYRGWPEKAPYDAIIVTCALDHVPEPLIEQLAMGGRLVIPVGVAKRGKWAAQTLVVIRKTQKGLVEEKRLSVTFLPMKGEAVRRKPS
jgi:protein-L-isoaspartate(D-aspartate) O-methyltransferase